MDINYGEAYKSTDIVNFKAIRERSSKLTIENTNPILDCRQTDGLRNKRKYPTPLNAGPIKPGPKLLLQKLLEKKLSIGRPTADTDEKASASVPNTSRDRKFIFDLSSQSIKKEMFSDKASDTQRYQPIDSDTALNLNFKRSFIRKKLPLYMQKPPTKLRKERLTQIMCMKPQEFTFQRRPISNGLSPHNESLMNDYVKFKCSESRIMTNRYAFTPRENERCGPFSVTLLRG